jgi:hypothetical protein
LASNLENGGFDGFKDLQVAGAAAQIARKRFANLVPSGLRVLIEQSLRGNQDCRSAVAALCGSEIRERLLQGMERTVRAQAFHGQDSFVIALNGEEQAGKNGFAFEQNGACAALAEFAAMFCSGVVEIFAENFEESFVGSEGDVGLFAV